MLTFPALLLVGVEPKSANIISTLSLLLGFGGSFYGYRETLPLVKKWVKYFLPASLLGGIAGGILLIQTPASIFTPLVPWLLLLATLLFMLQEPLNKWISHPHAHLDHSKSGIWIMTAVGFQFIIALYGGYFGAGIGILMLASFGVLGFKNIHEMNTLKGVLGFAINIAAAAYFVFYGTVDWPKVLVMGCAALIGGYIGADLALKASQVYVRRGIIVVGLLICSILLYRQYFK